MLQSYSDAQEEDSTNIKNQIRNLHGRIDELAEGGVVPQQNSRQRSPIKSNYTSVDAGN